MTALKLIMGSASADMEKRDSGELLRTLSEVGARLGALDVQRRAADESALLTVTEDVTQLLRTVLQTLSELEKSVERADPDDFSDDEPQTWVGFRPPVQTQPSRLEDVCFVAGFELSRALRGLEAATDTETRGIAAETAMRKLQRVLRAVTASGERSGGSSIVSSADPLRRRLDAELESSLAVRRLYVSFRRSLRRPEDESREAVLTALRYAAGGLATIAASPHYQAVRMSDRALLRRQRDRLLDWAHAGKPTMAGVQLLEDIFTCADLLRDINRRQELRAHDVTLIRELVGDTTRPREDWLTRLDRLAGLDDGLDALTAQLRSSPDMGPVIDIIVRLSLLVG